MTTRVLRVRYYWPALRMDCSNFAKKCLQCQKHEYLIHRLTKELHPMVSPWLFTIWGMDIFGPFPTAQGQRKFLLVAIDYFTKWVETEPLANITSHSKVLLEEYHYTFWNFEYASHRQWAIVHRPKAS